MLTQYHHRSSRARSRSAFTLVELLVVIAIIGILVGLLLPAVQASREAARRVSCMNNMTQLGLAMHHHEFSLEHLPSGVINPEGPIRYEESGQDVSWVVQILPYMEQQALYNHFDIEQGAYGVDNKEARAQIIGTMLCPSYPGHSVTSDAGETIGVGTYSGCHDSDETPIDDDNNGMLFLNSQIRYSQILDGSTHTILLGESIPAVNDLGWASGTRATLRNTSGFDSSRDWGRRQPWEIGSLKVGMFGSFHSGGANFTFADGSTRFLTQSIDPELYRKFGNRADGELLNE